MNMKRKNNTFNKSFTTVLIGLSAMIVACFIFYFNSKSYIAYSLFAIGFIFVGVGILLGFFKLVTENEN